MFYQIDDDVLSIDFDEINDSSLTLGYISVDELDEIYRQLGFSLQSVERCRESFSLLSCSIEIYDSYTFIRINDINTSAEQQKSCLAVYIRKNFLLVVNISEKDFSNRNIFMNMLSRISNQGISLEKIVCFLLEELIEGDNKQLDSAQIMINRLEEDVLTDKTKDDFNINLLSMKNELLMLRGYYEQLIDIGESLVENENDLFASDNLRCIRIFVDKVIRLRDNADLLRSSVVHLWDAYQASLDMRLNKAMKIFTLMTTIFFPLTVIVGWYGMNFEYMPELSWKYGYVFVIVFSVLVVVMFWLWFKKKRWL